MIYISIDIEATSIYPERGQIVEFAAIIEDTKKKLPFEEIPKFTKIIKSDSYKCDIFPIQMHKRIWDKLNLVNSMTKEEQRENNVIEVSELAEAFFFFLHENGLGDKKYIKINVAGKNVAGFDLKWINHHVPRWREFIQVRQRVLDPAILYWEPLLDEELPNLEKCKEKAGIENIAVSHDALEDAWDVIQVLRTKY